VLIVTRNRNLRFSVTSSRVGVTATVRGEGAMGVLGPKVTTRLPARPKAHHRAKKHPHRPARKHH
jgi:hypothetical protein